MIELTKTAKEQLDMHFSNKEIIPIRLYLAGRCGGPQLALSMDNQKENDEVHKICNYIFVIDSELMSNAVHIVIDYNFYTGFKIKSSLNTQSLGCGSCTSCS